MPLECTNVQMHIEMLNPKHEINNIFLWFKYLVTIENAILPKVFPKKVKTPIKAIINWLIKFI